MSEYIIRWNVGYGNGYQLVDAENEEEAKKIAYKVWRWDAENNANYGVVGEATAELKEEYL